MATIGVADERPGAPTPARRRWARAGTAVAHVTRTAWIGLVTGLIVGVLARALMRVSFLLRPDTALRLTEGGAVIGRFSLEETLSLVLFGGVINGLGAAAAYLATEPWLGRAGSLEPTRWHGPATVALSVALLGPHAFSDELDFVILQPPLVHVLLFGALPAVGGLVFWLLHRRVAGPTAGAAVPRWRWGLRAVGLLLFLPVLLGGHALLIFDTTFGRPAVAAAPPYLVAAAATVWWWWRRAAGRQSPRWLVRAGAGATALVLVLGTVQFVRVALDQL